MEKISLKAPAKINLYLKVLRKRPDGYHDIESLMQAIDLYDEITLERSDTIEIVCDDPSLPTDEHNLAVKAARALQDRFYFPGVRIELVKRIPHGSGLGGGSSDAAFVLRGLCQLYGLMVNAEEILEIAADLGSDVPFFLTGGQALAEGRGEILRPMKLPLNYQILLIVPPLHFSTAEVYSNLKINLTSHSASHLLKTRIHLSKLLQLMSSIRNDLEQAVSAKFLELDQIKWSLQGAGALYNAMSGSGSSVFGLFHESAAPADQIDDFALRGYRVYRCRPILLPPF